jgi:hypothetical protein
MHDIREDVDERGRAIFRVGETGKFAYTRQKAEEIATRLGSAPPRPAAPAPVAPPPPRPSDGAYAGVERVISGGQTGADQGGILAGTELGLRTGGWAPQGWTTEAGPAPWLANYGLREHASPKYPPRTRANVAEADGTLVFGDDRSRGCALTIRLASELGKPVFVVGWASGQPTPREAVPTFQRWLADHRIRTLNVAGNREERQPGIRAAVMGFLHAALRPA